MSAKRARRLLTPPYPFLKTAYLRVTRAREHLEDIKRRSKAYWDSTEKKVSFRLNAETNKLRLRKPLNLPPLPAVIGVLVGEVVYNLRSALDYLVFDLALLNTGVEQRGTQFPIEDSIQGWRSHVYPKGGRLSYLNGVSRKHIAAIKRCQPCRGGGGKRNLRGLARLREISNADKHRQWTVIAGMIQGSVKSKIGPVNSFGVIESGKIYRAKASDGREVDVHVDGHIRPYIVLSDGASVVHALEQLIAGVTQILDAFKPEFEGREAPGHRTSP